MGNNSYQTVSGIMQPRVKAFRSLLFALLRTASLRLRIVVKNFYHGTEIMKLCQEIAFPMYGFKCNQKYIQ